MPFIRRSRPLVLLAKHLTSSSMSIAICMMQTPLILMRDCCAIDWSLTHMTLMQKGVSKKPLWLRWGRPPSCESTRLPLGLQNLVSGLSSCFTALSISLMLVVTPRPSTSLAKLSSQLKASTPVAPSWRNGLSGGYPKSSVRRRISGGWFSKGILDPNCLRRGCLD